MAVSFNEIDGQRLRDMLDSNVLAVSMDVEGTDPFIHRIQAISVATHEQRTVTIPFPIGNAETQKLLQSILESESLKVFYDAKQALKVLRRSGFQVKGRYFDVQIANQLLCAGLPKRQFSLEDIAQLYGIMADTCPKLLLKLREALKNELAKAKLVDLAVDEFAAIRAVAEMELNGMLLNRAEWAKVRKIDTSGVDYAKHIHLFTGRIHPTYNQVGADTGRFTCTTPCIHSMKKNLRHCFVAPPGFKLVDADYSQQELRILAEVSGDARMMAEFNQDVDIYKAIGAKMFRQHVAAVTDSQRQIAKTTVLGLIYGSGTGRLCSELNARGLTITPVQAEQLKTAFFNQYPQVRAWYYDKQYAKVREVRSLGGRRRLWESDALFTELCNSAIQGTGADVLKKALAMMPDALKATSAKIIACVHDEILVEAKKDRAEEVGGILRNVMTAAWALLIKHVPIRIDVQIRDNWQ